MALYQLFQNQGTIVPCLLESLYFFFHRLLQDLGSHSQSFLCLLKHFGHSKEIGASVNHHFNFVVETLSKFSLVLCFEGLYQSIYGYFCQSNKCHEELQRLADLIKLTITKWFKMWRLGGSLYRLLLQESWKSIASYSLKWISTWQRHLATNHMLGLQTILTSFVILRFCFHWLVLLCRAL